jgi:hypothetical protein
MKKVELCWDAEHLQNVKNLLEGYVPGVSPAKLLLASPSLLLLPQGQRGLLVLPSLQ